MCNFQPAEDEEEGGRVEMGWLRGLLVDFQRDIREQIAHILADEARMVKAEAGIHAPAPIFSLPTTPA